uniref:Uncharacterized protein n=1 Tax=Leviviridae sp. TaxID=2027243 RepID=A0A514D7V3_9VIRU|nr:MAG: hypothetical protein H1BulkLitter54937_000002 [Leviviridae sp.]
MRYCSGIHRINRISLIVIRTTRFSEVSFRERLVDVNLKSVLLQVPHDYVRVFYGNDNIVTIDSDLSGIVPYRS